MREFDAPPSSGNSKKPTLTPEQVFRRGLQHQQSGRYSEAQIDYDTVLAVEPDHFGATYLLGLLFHQTGKQAEAFDLFSKATILDPQFFEAHANLGSVLQKLNRYEDAVASYLKALTLSPNSPETHYNLGGAYSELARFEDAVSSYKRAIQLKRNYAKAHNSLGNAYHSLGQLDDALASYQNTLTFEPNHRNAYFNIATIQVKKSAYGDAENNYLKALMIDPAYVEGLSNLGNVYAATSRLDQAIETFDRAIALNPDLTDIRTNKGNALRSIGKIEESLACYRAALSMDPANFLAHSNLIFTMGYATNITPADICHEADQWNICHGYKGKIEPHTNSPQPDRRLRIGFVSGDLRNHPVSQFLVNILTELDPGKLELFAYSNSFIKDHVTAGLKASISHWRNVAALGDQQLAEQIQADSIDILIDLSGHTTDNRLQVFTRKPAPVQVTWLGYGGTTGVKAIDYILCDRHVLPPEHEDRFCERPWRLPDVWVSFSPPVCDVEPGPLPALENGYVTFASFNSVTKITDQTISCWARVLHAVPESRLLLKAIQLSEKSAQEEVTNRFAAHGIDHQRLTLKGWAAKPEDHFADYQQVDIALDPFPYGGGTTSVEALWMGVPVLAKRGDRFVSNMGVSLGHCVGLESWVVDDEEDYINKAQTFASDHHMLSGLRGRLRHQVLASPLCDASLFARNFELACQRMWRKWCTTQPT